MEQLISRYRRVTEEEYLRAEDAAKDKHEFRDGQIIDMAGATPAHVAITTNLLIEMGSRLKGTPCRPYGTDLRVRVNESGNYCYADITVVCGPLEFAKADQQRMTVTNPRMTIEVTSPSTENVDRGSKFNDYRQIDGIWAIGPTITDLESTVKFRSLSIEISLAEIYAGLTLPVDSAKAGQE